MAVGAEMEEDPNELIKDIPLVKIHDEEEKEETDDEPQQHSEVITGRQKATSHTAGNKAGNTNCDVIGYVSDYVSEDDDAAVFLQQLGPNYGVSARSVKSNKSTFRGVNYTRTPSLTQSIDLTESVSDDLLGIVCRQQGSKALVEISNLVTRKKGDQHLYRLLSAKRNHIQQISNDIVYLQKKNKDLEDQNRLLVRLGKRQEAAIKKYHSLKSELPDIIEAHKREIVSMQERIRRMTESSRRDGNKIKSGDARVLKLTEEVTRLRELTKKKHLPERELLQQRLDDLSQELQCKNNIIKDLKHRLYILEKSVKQQVTAEVTKHRSVSKRLQHLQTQHSKLQATLKEREKDLGALQHYRGRLLESRMKRGSLSSSVATSSSASLSLRKRFGKSISSRATDRSDSASEVEISCISTVGEISTLAPMTNELSESSRLPPISIEEGQSASEGSTDPRKRIKSRVMAKDGGPWRAARQRQWQDDSSSPQGSSDDSIAHADPPTSSSPRAQSPLTSPPTPLLNTFNLQNTSANRDGLNKQSKEPESKEKELDSLINKEHDAMAVNSMSSEASSPDKHTNREESNSSLGFQSDDRFSLIGSYPPRERRRLDTEKESGSDYRSSGTPSPSNENDINLSNVRRGSLKQLNNIETRKPKLSDPEMRTTSSLSMSLISETDNFVEE